MRINIVSDLHCDIENFEGDFSSSDLIIIAGDVLSFEKTLGFLIRLMKDHADKRFIFVPGNHDFYSTDKEMKFTKMLELFRLMCDSANVDFLYNDVVRLPGLDIYGGTMWSDLSSLYGDQFKPMLKDWVDSHINDDRYIPGWSVASMLEENKKFMYGLRSFIKDKTPGVKQMVISHFAPSKCSVHNDFEHEIPWNSYWVNDIPEVREVDYWIHGHVHNNFDYKLGTSRVICNPRGYRNLSTGHIENESFDPNFTLNISEN